MCPGGPGAYGKMRCGASPSWVGPGQMRDSGAQGPATTSFRGILQGNRRPVGTGCRGVKRAAAGGLRGRRNASEMGHEWPISVIRVSYQRPMTCRRGDISGHQSDRKGRNATVLRPGEARRSRYMRCASGPYQRRMSVIRGAHQATSKRHFRTPKRHKAMGCDTFLPSRGAVCAPVRRVVPGFGQVRRSPFDPSGGGSSRNSGGPGSDEFSYPHVAARSDDGRSYLPSCICTWHRRQLLPVRQLRHG